MPRKFLPKVIPNENKEETAVRQQLSLENFKADINLRSNLLTELWENDCLKEQQKSVDIFDTKRDWYLNNTTTEFHNTSEK